MSPVTDLEGGSDAFRLPIIALEWHALEALRTLARFTTTTLLNQTSALANPQQHVRLLRAIGFALESGQGLSWEALLDRARWELRNRLAQPIAPDLIVYLDILELVLTLRRCPADLRFAPPGLGRQLVRLAVSLEHLLVLGSPSEPPGSPTFQQQALSARDHLLLEVTRALAALELREHLPQGHRVTVAELQRLDQALRHSLTQQAHGRDLSLDKVLDQAAAELTREQDEDDPTRINAVRDYLAASLLAPAGSDEALTQDSLLLLALTNATHALAQGHHRSS